MLVLVLFLSSIHSSHLGHVFTDGQMSFPYEESDGVMLLSILHGKQPLTIFDTDMVRTNLPAMLAGLSKKMLENQVFNLKYESYLNKVWLELKKEPLVKIGGINNAFQGSRTTIPPSIHLRRIPNTTRFQLMLEGRCLTVGDEITYKKTPARMLSFKACVNGKEDQVFVMIPSLKATIVLDPSKATHRLEDKMKSTFERINRIIDAVEIRQFG